MPAREPILACVHGDVGELERLCHARVVPSAVDSDAFLRADVLIADDRSGPDVLRPLRALRRDPRADDKLLLLVSGADPEARALADGLLANPADLAGRAALRRDRAASFARGRAPSSAEERLLFLLWAQPDAAITALPDWRHPTLYRYPLLEALLDPGYAADRWIASLLARQLIERAALVDRVRLCATCRSAHQNYVEMCPDCASIDVAQRPALHCFACGHVALQERFRREGVLICPNCDRRLRHIGSDYDRPLESWACNACQRLFVEPEVRARCLGCGALVEPARLLSHDVAHYRLSEQGRLAAHTGELGDVYSVLDQINYVAPDAFGQTLDWMLRLSRRHPESRFALLGVRLVNVAALVTRIGHARTLLLMDALADRLRETVRSTDFCTRTSEEQFWVLLPQIDAAGLRILEARLTSLLALSEQDDAERLVARLARFVSSDGGGEGESGVDLLARLASELA